MRIRDYLLCKSDVNENRQERITMNKTPLLVMLDQIRPELEPLASHYLTGQENIVKNRYLTLLAANILEVGGPSEVQIRLFEMLLASMKAECSVSFYLQQATALDNIELKEIIVFMKTDEEVINSYLFDLIILMRINGALSTPDVQRLSLQFAMFSVNELRAHRIIFWVLKMMMGGTTLDEDKLAEDIIASYEGRYGVAHSEFNAVNKFPNLVGNVVNDGVIYVVGVDCDCDNHYNKVSFPDCFVTKIHNTLQEKWPLWSNYAGRSNSNNPAIRIIPFLKGLSAWWPMLETTQINAKHEVQNKGGSDDAFVLKNTMPRWASFYTK